MIPEEKEIREALNEYETNHKFSRKEICVCLKYWFRCWKQKELKKYSTMPIHLTSRQGTAIWNAIQIATKIDVEDLEKEDIKILDAVKTMILENKKLGVVWYMHKN